MVIAGAVVGRCLLNAPQLVGLLGVNASVHVGPSNGVEGDVILRVLCGHERNVEC